MKKFYITLVFVFNLNIDAEIFTDADCQTNLLQTMKPYNNYSSRQGYGVVTFDITKTGTVKNIKGKDSQCAISRKDDGTILFKRCPFFKLSSYSAARYLKFSHPINKQGNSCSLNNQQYVFTYHKYNVKFKDPKQFLFDSDIKNYGGMDLNSKNEEPPFSNLAGTGSGSFNTTPPTPSNTPPNN